MIGWNVENILEDISQRRSALLKIRKVVYKSISEFLFLLAQNSCIHIEGNRTIGVRISIEFSGVKIFQVNMYCKRQTWRDQHQSGYNNFPPNKDTNLFQES